jgi:AcrR family transcriptional regulator
MVGRPRKVTDEQILDAAQRAIALHGPAQLTLAHIAGEVGVVPAALVQRFKSKRGLLVALAERAAGEVEAIFETAIAANESPIAALHQALASFVAGIDSPTTLANSLAFLQLDLVDPDLKNSAVAQSREMRAQIRLLLQAATFAGELVRHDHGRLAQAVYTTYSGSLITWAIDGNRPLNAWLQTDIDTLLTPYRPLTG